MKCPVCSRRLKALTVTDLTVDACSGGCGGIWFDAFELKKLESPHVAEGFTLLDIPIDPLVHNDHRRKRPCPRCDRVFLRRHLYNRSQQVEVDSCPNCNGYWLDVGELNQLRNSSKMAASAEKRSTVARNYYSAVAKPDLQELKSHGGDDARQARWIERLFKFILPK